MRSIVQQDVLDAELAARNSPCREAKAGGLAMVDLDKLPCHRLNAREKSQMTSSFLPMFQSKSRPRDATNQYIIDINSIGCEHIGDEGSRERIKESGIKTFDKHQDSMQRMMGSSPDASRRYQESLERRSIARR